MTFLRMHEHKMTKLIEGKCAFLSSLSPHPTHVSIITYLTKKYNCSVKAANEMIFIIPLSPLPSFHLCTVLFFKLTWKWCELCMCYFSTLIQTHASVFSVVIPGVIIRTAEQLYAKFYRYAFIHNNIQDLLCGMLFHDKIFCLSITHNF